MTTDAASPVKYGYVSDDGKDLRMDPEFQRALEPVAKHLRIGKHTVVGLDGTEHEVCISPDCKGLLAGDGRRYMIELYRCTPVDIGFLESHKAASSDYPHQFVVLRLELVEHFYEHKFRAYLKELSDKNKASKKQQPTDELPATENDEALDLDGVDTALLDYQLALNPDVFTDNPLGGDATAIRRDEDLVRDAGTYLRDVTIPGLVAEWHLLKSLPMDSATLTNAMHRRGINMRYLGSMVSQVDKIVADAGEAKTPQLEERATFIKDLCLHEMVIRAAKHVLRDWLRMAPVHESSTVIAHFFNCLLGGLESIATTAPSEESVYTITAHDLWARVIKDVHRRFGYDLNMDEFRTTIRKSAVLRALCIAVGIQLVPRDYFGATAAPTAKLSASNTKKGKKSGGATTSTVELPSFLAASPIAASALFQPADIVSMVPVTKTAAFSSRLADETYASGKIAFAQAAQQEEENKKVDTEASAESPLTVGMELLRESLQLHEVVYGPLHRNTALVLSSLALAHLESDSDASTGAPSETALALQQQAVAAMERSGGSFDSHDVITQYMNLAYFYQRSKRPLAALQCMRHVARCWSVVYGGVSSTGNACGHPEKAVVDASVASMLEATGDFSRAKAFMMDALATNRGFHGEQSLKVAQGYHALAQTHGLDADYKQALVLEKQAYRILEQMVGPEHAMTKEIDNWLKQWTKLAVEAAMRAKEVAQAVSEGAPLEEVASASSTAKQSKKGKKKTTATSGR